MTFYFSIEILIIYEFHEFWCNITVFKYEYNLDTAQDSRAVRCCDGDHDLTRFPVDDVILAANPITSRLSSK